MSVKVAIVCEAKPDFDIAACLTDRLICERIDWVDPSIIDSFRSYVSISAERQWLQWAAVPGLARAANLRIRGHFRGAPGDHDAHAARRAITLIRLLRRDVGVIMLVRDDDGDVARRNGLEQARQDSELRDRIIIGVAARKRECWILAGFVAEDEAETHLLDGLRQELGFNPCTAAENLRAKSSMQDARNAKRVLRILTGSNPAREERCWSETSLDTLRTQGRGTGIVEFLNEIELVLVPLL